MYMGWINTLRSSVLCPTSKNPIHTRTWGDALLEQMFIIRSQRTLWLFVNTIKIFVNREGLFEVCERGGMFVYVYFACMHFLLVVPLY